METSRRPSPDAGATYRSGAGACLFATVAWSATFWLLSPLLSPGLEPAVSPVFLLGGAGPLIVAVALTARESREVRRNFWRRIVDARLIQGRWWFAVLGLHPVIIVAACGGAAMLSGQPLPLTPLALDVVTAAGAWTFLSTALFTFWFGPLPEEIGWRGFAQDRLVEWRSPLVASLLLGAIWALWHLPLFFVPGTFQHAMGIGHARFWVFMFAMMPLSVVMGWVWLRTRRSTLGAALVHFSGNFASLCVLKSTTAALIELVLLCVVALIAARRMGVPRATA